LLEINKKKKQFTRYAPNYRRLYLLGMSEKGMESAWKLLVHGTAKRMKKKEAIKYLTCATGWYFFLVPRWKYCCCFIVMQDVLAA